MYVQYYPTCLTLCATCCFTTARETRVLFYPVSVRLLSDLSNPHGFSGRIYAGKNTYHTHNRPTTKNGANSVRVKRWGTKVSPEVRKPKKKRIVTLSSSSSSFHPLGSSGPLLLHFLTHSQPKSPPKTPHFFALVFYIPLLSVVCVVDGLRTTPFPSNSQSNPHHLHHAERAVCNHTHAHCK
jgi:hypothetical protein